MISPAQTTGPTTPSLGRLLVLSLLVGAAAGVGAIVFYTLLEGCRTLLLDYLAGYRPPGPAGEPPLFGSTDTPLRPLVLFLLPAAGGLLSGFLVWRFAPEAGGHSTDSAIDAYHHKGGAIRARVPFVRAITAAITIGSGGSGGREGPIALIGAGCGSALATWLRLAPHERRALLAAGMAAGVGSIFHAPLAGALFAAEVLYRELDVEHEVLVPAFIASITAYSIFTARFGWQPVFSTPDFAFLEVGQLLPYLGLALVVALGAVLTIEVFHGVQQGFTRWRIPAWLKPAAGGLVVGAVGIFMPQALGISYGVLQSAFYSQLTAGMLLAIALTKIVTTAFTIGSGGSGGVFGPSVVIGGSLGGAVGLIAQQALPTLDIDAGAFVLVGMAGFFAAAAKCPIATIIMVSEMTGSYQLLVPAMLVCTVAYLLCKPWTLYGSQLGSRLEAPSKMGNMLGAVLRRIPVREALAGQPAERRAVHTLTEDLNLRSIIQLYRDLEQGCFPVVDAQGELRSVVLGRDIRKALGQEDVSQLVVARDLGRSPVVVRMDETLLDAVQRMALTKSDELLVIEGDPPGRPTAILTHHDVLAAYDRALLGGR